MCFPFRRSVPGVYLFPYLIDPAKVVEENAH